MDTTHDPIQRFSAYHSGDPHKVGLWADGGGYWVTYADHVEAVRQARADTIRINAEFHYSRECEQVGYDRGRADERKAAAERVLGALDTERIKWQYRVDTSDGEESMIGRRYVDYVEAMERAIELAAVALGEGE